MDSNGLHFSQANRDSPLLSAHIDAFSKGNRNHPPIDVLALKSVTGENIYYRDSATGAIRKTKSAHSAPIAQKQKEGE